MLNPELKKDINIEINKSEPLIQEFLTGDYFRETLDLVFKVNRLNDVQQESVELETILYVLNLSNYDNISGAIKTECSIETTNTVKQLSDDLEKYIFSKLEEKQLAKIEEKEGMTVKKIDLVKIEDSNVAAKKDKETNTIDLDTTNIPEINTQKDVAISTDTHKLKNLLDENFDIKNPRDLVKNIITPENKTTVTSNMTPDISSNSKENMKAAEEKIETKLGDVYRERVDLGDAESVTKTNI